MSGKLSVSRCIPYAHIMLATVLSVSGALMTTFQSRYMGTLADALTNNSEDYSRLILVIILFSLLLYLSSVGREYFIGKAEGIISLSLRKSIAQVVYTAPYRSVETLSEGDSLTSATSDVDRVQGYWKCVTDSIHGIVLGLAAMILCIIISWKLTVFSLIIIPVVFGLSALATAPMSKAARQTRTARGVANGIMLNTIQNLVLVKAYAAQNSVMERYLTTLLRLKNAEFTEAKAVALASTAGRLSGGLSVISIFLIGAYFVFGGEVTLGEFYAFALVFSNVQELMAIQTLITEYRRYHVASSKIDRLLAAVEPDVSIADSRPLAYDMVNNAFIVFDRVTFQYDEHAKTLKEISFSIMKGQRAAFVGHSGSGKSTLIKLMATLYMPQNGDVYINSHNSKTHPHEIRKRLAIVTQDSYLFPTTIRENILLGKLDATDAEIEQACFEAGIIDLIKSLPDGLDTNVEERGGVLSGGERQRICIARAILRDASIVILDEPTSALDVFSEMYVMKSIGHLARDRTTIMVSHRFSSIADSDIVFALSGGEIVQYGSPSDLATAEGIFCDLFVDRQNRVMRI